MGDLQKPDGECHPDPLCGRPSFIGQSKKSYDDDDDGYQVGEAILGVFAIFIRDYVTLQWVMSVVTLVQVHRKKSVCDN